MAMEGCPWLLLAALLLLAASSSCSADLFNGEAEYEQEDPDYGYGLQEDDGSHGKQDASFFEVFDGEELEEEFSGWDYAYGKEGEEGASILTRIQRPRPDHLRRRISEKDVQESVAVDELLQWMHANGAGGVAMSDRKLEVAVVIDSGVFAEPQSVEIPKQKLRDGGERSEFGLSAAADFVKGETLFSIPKSLWVSDQHVANEVLPYEGAPYDVVLAGWILREVAKGRSSFWAPFVNIFPKKIQLPIFWTPAQLEEIDYPSAIKKVRNMRAYLASEHAKYKRGTDSSTSYDEFAWAMALVWTRCFHLEFLQGGGEGEGVGAREASFLLPFLDLANHGFEAQAHWEEHPSGDTVTVKAIADVEKGMQVHLLYGSEDNEWFLTEYGFVPEPNPHNSFPLFKRVSDMVHWYSSTYWSQMEEQALLLSPERAVDAAEVEAKKAIAAVVKHVGGREEPKERNGPEFELQDGAGFALWPEAHIDPRALAAIAATYFSYSKSAGLASTADILNPDLDYAELAFYAVNFGWHIDGIACSSVEQSASSAVASSLEAAAAVLYDLIVETLQTFKTSYEEDLELWNGSLSAQEICTLDEKSKECELASGSKLSPEMAAALLFRMSKKALLAAVGHRIKDDCGSRGGRRGREGEGEGEEGEGEEEGEGGWQLGGAEFETTSQLETDHYDNEAFADY